VVIILEEPAAFIFSLQLLPKQWYTSLPDQKTSGPRRPYSWHSLCKDLKSHRTVLWLLFAVVILEQHDHPSSSYPEHAKLWTALLSGYLPETSPQSGARRLGWGMPNHYRIEINCNIHTKFIIICTF
jgi:hypothetical protein